MPAGCNPNGPDRVTSALIEIWSREEIRLAA